VIGTLLRGTLQQSGIPRQRRGNRAAIGQINDQAVALPAALSITKVVMPFFQKYHLML
jgi:hypothetical protein